MSERTKIWKIRKTRNTRKAKNWSGGGQCELDDDALEQAAGGSKSKEWADEAWEWVKEKYT